MNVNAFVISAHHIDCGTDRTISAALSSGAAWPFTEGARSCVKTPSLPVEEKRQSVSGLLRGCAAGGSATLRPHIQSRLLEHRGTCQHMTNTDNRCLGNTPQTLPSLWADCRSHCHHIGCGNWPAHSIPAASTDGRSTTRLDRTKARQLPLVGFGHSCQCIWGFAKFCADDSTTNRGTRWHPETANLGQNRLRLSKRGDVVQTRPAMEVVAPQQFSERAVFASFGVFCQ